VDNQRHFKATDYVRNDSPGLDAAERLALAIVEALRGASDCTVLVSLHGLRGISSSFFNLLLGTVLDELGADAIRRQVTFETETRVQSEMLDRSRSAVLGEDAA
jgi:hypothetical protein